MSKKSKHYLKKEGIDILRIIDGIRSEMEISKHNFDFATDDILIDSYIYEINSLNKKYQYFIKLAKENGLIADGFNKKRA